MAQRLPAPGRDNVRLFPTPDVRDKMVFIEFDSKLPAHQTFAYGQAHPDPIKYPDFKMVWYSPESEERRARWWFTNERADQDAYNYVIDGEDRLIRTYLFPRENYPDDYDTLPFGSDDPLFGNRYQFTHEMVSRAEEEYDGYFVKVQRIYQELVQVRQYYDDDLDRDVTETSELIEKGTGTTASVPGTTVEIEPVNTFYDRKITSHLVPGSGDNTDGQGNILFPAILETLPMDVNYRFPDLLQYVGVVSAYAYAYSSGAPPAYEEDYYFDVVIKEAAPGPHEGRMLRFLTDAPDVVRANYPLLQLVAQPETVPLVAAWYYASPDGNSAFALAKQVHIPSTVHPTLPINGIDTLAIVQQKTTLPATPGFTNFASLGTCNVGFESRKTKFGLYEIRVTQINCSGIYSGQKVPFDQPGGTTGGDEQYVNPVEAPSVTTAIMAPDNRSISGTATISSAISVLIGNVGYGLTMSDTSGNYTVQLSQVFTDVVTFEVRARRGGQQSGPLLVSTFDLSPVPPSVSIDAALLNVQGSAEPGSTITITPTVTFKQKMSNTIVATVTTAGTAEVVVLSNLLAGGATSLYVPVAVTDDAIIVANKIKEALNENGLINLHFSVTSAGDEVFIETRVAAVQDATLDLIVADNTSVGVSSSSAVTVQVGLGVVTVVTDNTGFFTYTYPVALTGGTVLNVTATDGGGTSTPTVVTANSAPPTLVDAVFVGYSGITGVAEVLGSPPGAGDVEVVALLNGAVVATAAVSSVDGSYDIDLGQNYIRGEVFQVVAQLTSDATVRSFGFSVTAPNLNLPVPTYKYSNTLGGYVGVAPSASALPAGVVLPTGLPGSLIVRYEPDAPAVTEFEIFAANNEFVFTLDEGGQNGQRYAIYFRYEDDLGNFLGYSNETYISSPTVPLPGARVYLAPPTEGFGQPNWIDAGWPGPDYDRNNPTPLEEGMVVPVYIFRTSTIPPNSLAYYGYPGFYPADKLLAVVPPTTEPGTLITIKFPGQDIPDIGPEAPEDVYYFGDVPSFPFVYRAAGQLFPAYWQSLNKTVGPGNQGWYQNADYPTKAAVKNVIPDALRIITQAPDGRISETLYDRDASYPYNTSYGSGI